MIRAILTSGSMRSLRHKPDRSCATKPGHTACHRHSISSVLANTLVLHTIEPAHPSGAFMANEEHVARLKQGVNAWNAWTRFRPAQVSCRDTDCAPPSRLERV